MLNWVLQIGNEFAQVEALWSQFENVMGNSQTEEKDTQQARTGKNATT